MNSKTFIKPQPGPQRAFLSTSADIAIYGGSAGSGKSFGLLLEPLRHYRNPRFGAVIFRRNTVQVRNEGGLWDESVTLYSQVGADPHESVLEWTFPAGGRVKFSHLEHEKTVYDWQGSQIPMIGFDEITHFTAKQFWYMLSRNRSDSGVPGYIRATCNPDPDSFVRPLIDWWIGEDGYPIKARSGVIRWFVRLNNELIWADSEAELFKKFGKGSEIQPKSLTFIPAKLQDNKILMAKDPSYLANLLALSHVDRMRLLDGNWNIRPSGGLVFQMGWFPVVDAIPSGWKQVIRYWDRGATAPSAENPDPDWTRGIKVYQYHDGTFIVADLRSMRDTPGKIEGFIKNVASFDGVGVRIMAQQDPGSAGVSEAEHFVRMLGGFDVKVETAMRDKFTRAKPVSAQAEAGNIRILRAGWNNEFFNELENFTDDPGEYAHDDIVDALSGAFNVLAGSGRSSFDVTDRLAGATR